MKTIAVIGDIHGCVKQLIKLYDKILKYTDDVYSVGDLIDRGEYSKEAVQFCIDNQIKPVMGNHEYTMLQSLIDDTREKGARDKEALRLWMYIGADKTIESYCKNTKKKLKDFTKELIECGHYDYIKSLPLSRETDTCIISHGGIVSGKTEINMLYNRQTPSKLNKLQVIGHTPEPEAIYRKGHYVNIDTGCIYWGKLSAVIVSEDASCDIISAQI
ncbi:MAG: metallophosphoesterase [Candidatus Kapaibacterium sp.]